MSYAVIKRLYRSAADLERGRPYRTVNMTEHWNKPLTKDQAGTVKNKMTVHPLWTYTVEHAK